MDDVTVEFTSDLWLYPGEGGWHFVTLPHDVADLIDEGVGERGGFGSIRVEATIGMTSWQTSLFPDKKAGSFVLPIKKAVRAAEGLELGSACTIRLRTSTASTE